MKTAKDIASDVLSQLSGSIGDIAGQTVSLDGEIFRPLCGENRVYKNVLKAMNDGVQDLHGWLADELYNDSQTISDFIGDWVYNHVSEALDTNDEFELIPLRIEVYKELVEIGHTAVEVAVQKKIEIQLDRLNWLKEERLKNS